MGREWLGPNTLTGVARLHKLTKGQLAGPGLGCETPTFQKGDLAEEQPINKGATSDGRNSNSSQVEKGFWISIWDRGADAYGNQTSQGDKCDLNRRGLRNKIGSLVWLHQFADWVSSGPVPTGVTSTSLPTTLKGKPKH